MKVIDDKKGFILGDLKYGSIKNSKFDESKIKRDSDGQFSSAGGSSKKLSGKDKDGALKDAARMMIYERDAESAFVERYGKENIEIYQEAKKGITKGLKKRF